MVDLIRRRLIDEALNYDKHINAAVFDIEKKQVAKYTENLLPTEGVAEQRRAHDQPRRRPQRLHPAAGEEARGAGASEGSERRPAIHAERDGTRQGPGGDPGLQRRHLLRDGQ